LLRGVPGVFGRATSRLLALRAGEPGTVFKGLDFERSRCERDSEVSVALNFLTDDITLGVVERGMSEYCETDDNGRLGVNGTCRVWASLSAASSSVRIVVQFWFSWQLEI
jgi:hypothetical protein